MKQFSEFHPARRVILFLSSGFMSGYIPFASGTFATLLAIPLFFPLSLVNQLRFPGAVVFVGLVLGLSALAIWLSDVAEKTYGEKDSHKIVVDEIVGFFVAMAFVPYRGPHLLAAFVLFRFFDVAKPLPIHRLQRLPGGWGVVADDLLAGLYSCVVLHIVRALGWLP